MKNLKKFTKAELIEKLNEIKKDSNLIKNEKFKPVNTFWRRFVSYFDEIMTLLRLIQELMFKITMITFLYKLFKKFPILKKMGRYLYKILFSISAFSLANHWGIIDIITHFWSFV